MSKNSDFHYSSDTVEIRSMGEGKPVMIRGYAAVYGQPSRVLMTEKGNKFIEIIEPGAFDRADKTDLVAAFQHRSVLAKYPDTLEVGTDERGLWYQYEHDPSDPDHMAVFSKIRRGVVSGSSFKFDVDEDLYTKERRGNMGYRTLKRGSVLNLYDVGPVVNPAYRSTTAAARSMDALFEEKPPEADKKSNNHTALRLRVFLSQFNFSK